MFCNLGSNSENSVFTQPRTNYLVMNRSLPCAQTVTLYYNHVYSHILEYIKCLNRAIQCKKDKVCYKACNAINFMK